MRELSIIVPCFNEVDFTRMCLESITTSELPFDTEVILVDDGSTDATSSIELDGNYKIDILIRHKVNKGFAPSVNEGIGVSTGERIAIFNNDTIVPKNWFECLGQVWSMGGLTQHCGIVYPIGMVSAEVIGPEPTYFGEPSLSESFEEFMEKHKYNTDKTCYPLNLFKVGGPWIFNKEVFDDVGLFDERFVPGQWEDIDFFLRMTLQGYLFTTMENCYIYHFGSETIRKQFPQLGGRGGICDTNREKFKEKWGIDGPEYVDPKIDWQATLRAQKLVLRDG